MLAAPRGAIVGVARLIACISPHDDRLPADQRIWADPDQFKFLFEDVRAFLTQIPFPGRLGFFGVPDGIVANALASTR
jgi:hypothetical protein